MLDYRLEHLFSYHLKLNPPEIIGPVPDGIRANVYTSEGTVTGEKLQGKLRPVGGDWVTVRPDGVAITDVRGTIETDNGALIYITYTGVMDLGEDGYSKFLQKQLPASAKIHNTPRLQTAHPEYRWLNRLQCISIAELDFTKFEADFDVYGLR
ncbi:MAG: DUF3237 domain-containing protein [Scytonematopsis contorta HA4267-MV1]|jgi:hypothetical protein|nr:DUF3237 domain-containing protein [Scytonematopsis contorta HA4267-MV1]